MNDSQFRLLVEKSWRRPLTEEEQVQLTAWLAAHPEDRAAWEEEDALNRSLDHLAAPPVASNFTGLVMQAVRQETTPARSAAPLTERVKTAWGRITWRLACAALMVSMVWLGLRQHQAKVRQDVAKGLVVLANSTLPDPAILEDFDAIQRLSQTSSEDEELYAVLNQ